MGDAEFSAATTFFQVQHTAIGITRAEEGWAEASGTIRERYWSVFRITKNCTVNKSAPAEYRGGKGVCITMNKKNIPQSLISKLAEACNAVGGVEKKGRNEFQRYDYVKAADVAKAIRHELFERGIVVLIDEKEWSKISEIMTNGGHALNLMQLRAEITFQDENSKLGPISAFSTAMDSGDKAIYKAKTGLLKYALRGLGLIPDEKDDPEFDESVDEATSDKVLHPTDKASRKKDAKIKDYQARAWDAACHQSGKTAEQVAKYLRTRWSAASVMELSQEDFKEAIKWAAGTEDLAQTLETSKQALAKKPVVPIDGQANEFDQRVAGD